MPSLDAISCAKQYLENDTLTALCSIFNICIMNREMTVSRNNPDLGHWKLAPLFPKMLRVAAAIRHIYQAGREVGGIIQGQACRSFLPIQVP